MTKTRLNYLFAGFLVGLLWMTLRGDPNWSPWFGYIPHWLGW